MTDVLATWWVHHLVVERFADTGAYGDEWDASETVTGFYSDRTRYEGGQIVASGQFAFPRGVAYVPVQSKITLPAEFGGRTCRVVSVEVGDSGGLSLPAHQVVEVL